MAVRQEDLLVREALVYRFPTHMVRARRAHRQMIARRRRTLGVLSIAIAAATLASMPPL